MARYKVKIALDIETVKISKEKWAAMRGIDLTGIGEDVSIDVENSSIEKEYQKSVFDGTYSRIICIGMIVFDDDLNPMEALAWYGDNEAEILRRFWQRIAGEGLKQIITYNGLGFDIPFIKKRSIIHRVKPTVEINLARFRTEPIYDVMAIWANWETRGYTRLDTLARVLGVETKSGSGAQVAEMWDAGRRKEVAEYCLQDTYVTYACYCRMTYRQVKGSDSILSSRSLLEIR